MLVLSVLWGSTFYFTKLLLPVFHPVSIVFYRCLFGAIMLLPIFLFQRNRGSMAINKLHFLVGITLLSAGVPWIIMSFSLRNLDTTISAVLNATGPIFGVLLVLFLFKGQVRKREITSVAVGFIGIASAFFIGSSSLENFRVASAMLLIAAVSLYALSAVLTGKYLTGYSVVTLSFVTMAVGTIFSAPVMLLVQPTSWEGLKDFRHIFFIIMLGALNSGIGNLLYYYIVKKGGPIFALSITYLMPIMTIFLGFFLLHEPVGFGTVISLIFVLSSVYLSKRKDVEA
nr:DMT family transporter [Sporosarcina cyprini]